MKDTGILRRVNYKTPESERESTVSVGKPEARKYLKSVIHELDALFWDEDLSDAEPNSGNETQDKSMEARSPSNPKKTYWSLRLELNNGSDKEITFYNQMHDAPQNLFWSLMELFE